MKMIDFGLNGLLYPMLGTNYLAVGNYIGRAWNVRKFDSKNNG
jgi:hypothetical protein